jgi:hypothetical protein
VIWPVFANYSATFSKLRLKSGTMKFRIAIGRCACQPPYRNAVEECVCKAIHATLTNWRGRLPADVAAVPTELFEEQIVEGCRVSFATYKLGDGGGTTLVVRQALVHTWSRPTYLSIGAVGRLYAEGLLLTADGNVEPASDDLMWQFR